MKKLLFLLIALCGTLFVQAQNEVMKVNLGDTVVTLKIADIHEITFGVEEEAPADTTLFHSFNGYITVSTAYFTDSYYGDAAKLAVYRTSAGEFIVTFSDPVWGEAFFGHVSVGRELQATGIIAMDNHRGGVTEYDATLSGPMTTPVITIPTVMGGTSITFHVGAAPEALKVAGQHKGSMSVMVGGQFGPYTNESVTHTITANEDGTIDVTIPEYGLTGTVMGNLTLGTYTVKGLAWNEERQAFYRDYSADGLQMHFVAVKDGATTLDANYDFSALGTLEVKTGEQGLTIVNNFQPGRMPFRVEATFVKSQGR